METSNIHIGEVIDKWIRIHNITQAKFAQLLGMPTTNAARLLKKKTIDTYLLQFISMQLKHNFFQVFVSVQDNDVEDCPHVFVHIGESINRRLKELRMQQVDFAARLGIYQPEVSKIIKKGSIDTGKLAAISKILDYNFFEEFYYNLSGIEHKNKYNMETRTTDLLKRLVLFHGAKPEVEAIQEYARVIEKELRKSICDEIMKNVTEKVTEKANENATDKLLDSKLFEFALTVRTLNILKLNGIDTVRDLISLTPIDFHRLRSIGPKAFTELDDFLKSHNLKWGMNV